MTTRSARALGLIAAAVLALSACSSDGDDETVGPESPAPAPTTSSTAEAPVPDLMTAETEAGTIVTDGAGMTVYMYDPDEQGSGASTCFDVCLASWPVVAEKSGTIDLEGITGEVTTITGNDGSEQLVLNGWPLYYFLGDQAPGDVVGQGSQDVWWVLDAAGEPIRD